MTEQAIESGRFLPEMMITVPERQRRWTVLLRFLILIPHFIILYLLGIAANVVVFLGWWAALFIGRLPEWIAGFLGLYLDYSTRVMASAMLLTDRYPMFVTSGPEEVVHIEIHPGRLNRLAVLFRIILIIPAGIVTAVALGGWEILSFFFWLIILVMGRVPRPIFDASAAVLRYNFRFNAYFRMLTGAYPKGLFGDHPAEPHEGALSPGTRPLSMSRGGKVLLIVFIVLGVAGCIGYGVVAANAPQPHCHGYSAEYECDYAE